MLEITAATGLEDVVAFSSTALGVDGVSLDILIVVVVVVVEYEGS
jgi:hypothetical protein